MRDVEVIGGIGEKNSNNNTQWQFQNRIYNPDGLSPSLTTLGRGYLIPVERENMKLKIRYLSLFSGIGGFEYGLQKSTRYNFECVGYSEVDKYAENIYKKHYPNHPRLGDVTQINPKDLPQFDLLVGGFPCQAFSIAGQRRGFDDCRGTLFFEIARILKDKRPKYFLLENVRGLLSHNKGETFKTILKVLSDLGYNVEWQVLNSAHFGVPQRRERVFIKGYSREECRGEVLYQREYLEESPSERMREREDCKQLNNYRKTHQDGRIYSADGLSIGLNERGNNGWYDIDGKLEESISKKFR